jgi:hypothetical protein
MPNGDRLIEYGSRPFQATITSEVFQGILQQFHGRALLLGASYDNPPLGSLGAWLTDRLSGRNLAVYVGSVLIHEGHAEWEKTENGISLHFLA